MPGHAARPWAALALLSLLACGAGKLDGDESDTAAGADMDGSLDVNDNIQFDGDGPVIVSGRVWCQAGSDSSGMIFIFDVQYADPQGDYDVEGGEVTGQTKSTSTFIFSDNLLVCRDGQCDGSFRDGHYDPITCSTADDYEFIATVTDRSGLISETVLLDWED